MTALPAVSAGLDGLFLTVCHNEGVASYRDLEDSLAPVARALLAGWRPDPRALEGVACQRAAYLIEVLSGWMPAAQARAWWIVLESLAARREEFMPAPFFHGDPVNGPCQDEVARRWNLTRGVNIARLRQVLEPPYVV
jgi:hypothetical protein